MDKKLNGKEIINSANAMRVQKHQQEGAFARLSELNRDINRLDKKNKQNNEKANIMLELAEELMHAKNLNPKDVDEEDRILGESLIGLEENEYESIRIKGYENLDLIDIEDGASWEYYLDRIENYSEKYSINLNKDPFEDLSVKIFEEGYDARFGMAQVITVVINELLIRFLWGIKSYYIDGLHWKECIFTKGNPNLRRVLLIGYGVLCIVDGIDAGLRSKGQILLFGLHINFVAWKRLAFSGLMEIRALYKENTLDLNAMEMDLEREWTRLYEM